MKCKRDTGYRDLTWAQLDRISRKYDKNYWKRSCLYSTRWRMCAKAFSQSRFNLTF